VSAGDCSIVLRRFVGPQAEEIAILCHPDGRSQETVEQSHAAYRALAEALAARQASFRDLTSETLFLRDIRRDLPLVLGARMRVLAEVGQAACAPLPAFIGQAPVDRGAAFELTASAVVPRDRDAWSVRDVRTKPSCPCEGCARSGARLVRLGGQSSLYTASVYGAGGDTYEQARSMFRAAERLLEECDMEFRDVVRTWIHLRDIGRDYDALNAARREFFRHCGIGQRPASTGVQGFPLPDVHDCSLSVHAVKSARPLDVRGMSTPFLNEAWSYGADFSRGLRLVEANRITLHVSGTASIDEAGGTVHAGGFEAQAERMLDNIESLLARQGASFESLICGVTYLRHPGDAPVLRSICRRRGFEGFPCALVEAALCRPELLCEAEAVAMLPPKTAGA
jgi:enamine deaminase RidA (YjgF/YER057c/UK114 family)